MKEEQLGQPQIQTINRKIMYLDAAMVGPRVNPGMASRSSLPLFWQAEHNISAKLVTTKLESRTRIFLEEEEEEEEDDDELEAMA